MSIYHNNQHMTEDNEKLRFLVDREGEVWTIIVMFSRIERSMGGHFIFVASNELGYDEASVLMRITEDEGPVTDAHKAPQMRETVPRRIVLSPAEVQRRVLNFVIESQPLPHVELWVASSSGKGQLAPCQKVSSLIVQ